MRDTDRPDPAMQPLPPPIRKESSPEAERWTPITSTPGYERNQCGDVRRKHLPVPPC